MVEQAELVKVVVKNINRIEDVFMIFTIEVVVKIL